MTNPAPAMLPRAGNGPSLMAQEAAEAPEVVQRLHARFFAEVDPEVFD